MDCGFGAVSLVVISLAFIIWRAVRWYLATFAYHDLKGRFIVVTGCDTGFGHILARELYARGANVVAVCLTQEASADFNALVKEEHEGLGNASLAVQCDVRDHDEIVNLRDRLERLIIPPDQGLYAIVNNAGISCCNVPFQLASLDDYKRDMAVNFFAIADVNTQLFWLLLRGREKGEPRRIVNMTSAAGLLSGPFLSSYGATKFAAEGYSDSIRRELLSYNVSVSVIEPVMSSTRIVEAIFAHLKRIWERTPANMKAFFGEDFDERLRAYAQKITASQLAPADTVAAYMSALTCRCSYNRYRVGQPLVSVVLFARTFLPDAVLDWIVSKDLPVPKALS